jgi:putative acetyltransferase
MKDRESDLSFILRPYVPTDEAAAIELWRRTWQQAYPIIDFDQRLDWWRQRWREEILPTATIVVAEQEGELVGFVTMMPDGYLDQIVVAPENWSSGMAEALLGEAKQLAPGGIALHVNKDNRRAVRFYEKHGFIIQGDDRNQLSGRPVYKMSWRPGAETFPPGPEKTKPR